MSDQEDTPVFVEAVVTVNGYTLSTAEAMTLRVALGNFAIELTEGCLKGDALQPDLHKGYLRCIATIGTVWRKGA